MEERRRREEEEEEDGESREKREREREERWEEEKGKGKSPGEKERREGPERSGGRGGTVFYDILGLAVIYPPHPPLLDPARASCLIHDYQYSILNFIYAVIDSEIPSC